MFRIAKILLLVALAIFGAMFILLGLDFYVKAPRLYMPYELKDSYDVKKCVVDGGKVAYVYLQEEWIPTCFMPQR